jgi:succinate dehydrogenase/fumarate reductase flavoprotein subunit
MSDIGPDFTSLSADVLVVGGGPAGTWAAIKAAQAGADVVLADKGRCGSSGATASVGTGIWYVEDSPERREAAMASREALGGHLADREWMARVMDAPSAPGWPSDLTSRTSSGPASAAQVRASRDTDPSGPDHGGG